jgi:hypothetical protein
MEKARQTSGTLRSKLRDAEGSRKIKRPFLSMFNHKVWKEQHHGSPHTHTQETNRGQESFFWQGMEKVIRKKFHSHNVIYML